MKLYDNDAYRNEFMETVYNLLSGDSSNDRANQVIDLFDAAPAVEAEPAPLNDPLTLEQLREMDGEPVYVTSSIGEQPMWYIVDIEDRELKNPWDRITLEEWDEGYPYKAYRRKPEV